MSSSSSSSSSSEEEEAEYIVEAIRAWRYHDSNRRHEFLIKWQGWDEKDNTWEPRSNLSCDELLKSFIDNLDEKQKLYFHDPDPSRLTGFQRNATFVRCVGADGPHDSDVDETSDKQDKQPYYVLVMFNDSELAEEVTIKELYKNKPDVALEFCESRVLLNNKV